MPNSYSSGCNLKNTNICVSVQMHQRHFSVTRIFISTFLSHWKLHQFMYWDTVTSKNWTTCIPHTYTIWNPWTNENSNRCRNLSQESDCKLYNLALCTVSFKAGLAGLSYTLSLRPASTPPAFSFFSVLLVSVLFVCSLAHNQTPRIRTRFTWPSKWHLTRLIITKYNQCKVHGPTSRFCLGPNPQLDHSVRGMLLGKLLNFFVPLASHLHNGTNNSSYSIRVWGSNEIIQTKKA